jgi:hypothetical protein
VPETEQHEVAELIARDKRWKAALDPHHRAFTKYYDYAIKLVQLDPKKREALVAQGRQPVVTLALYNIIRYCKAILGGLPIYLDVNPVGPGKTDAETKEFEDAAQIAKSVMYEQIRDVDLGYPKVRRRFVYMGQAVGAGSAKLEVCTSGPYGVEIVPKHLDPRNVTWDSEEFSSFNDHGCMELCETIRPLLEWAKNNPDFDPTSRALLAADDGENLIPRPAEPSSEKQPANGDDGARITLKVFWRKAEPEEVEVDTEPKPLDPSQWHMGCDTCGYSEADLVGTEGYDGSMLPEMQPCPQCGETPEGMPVSMMHRIDTEKEIGRYQEYSDKHRKITVAPFCPQAGILRDAPWPKGLTNFPFLWHCPDPYPLEPSGNSQTSLNIDLNSLKNKHLRLMDEQMERNHDLTVSVEGSFWDAQHEPFKFDGTQGWHARVGSSEQLRDIAHYQGSGLNSAAPVFMQRIDEELGSYRGMGQVNVQPQDMKGMQVGVVARAQETGDVPLDEMARILRDDEQPFLQRWLELLCTYMTLDQWIETAGPDGAKVFRIFNGSQMPRLRLRVQSTPNLNAVDMDKISKIKELVGAPAALIRFALKDANVPQEVINELIQGSSPPAGGMVPNGLPAAPPIPAMAGLGG